MATKVNLDALIPREDFEVEDITYQPSGQIQSLSINDLKQDAFFFSGLRKPDFQRETSEWDSKKICEFIESFVNGDLIPAIILWKSPTGFNFVVDGAHRLSALAAWINDDFGDRKTSVTFYEGVIPNDQKDAAEETRTLLKKIKVGTFEDYQLATSNPEKADEDFISKARILGTLPISIQWINGDATKAEKSFFKINKKATPIDKTEERVLNARKKPTGIATRAIVRGGKGHKYWAGFSNENQIKIEKLAKDIHNILFEPPLNTPVKTLDLPIAGKAYSAQTLPLVLDFVSIVNGLKIKDSLKDDVDGTETINYLTNCRKVVRRISSTHASSLGLHPIVYFYSQNGRHKPASFYAITLLMLELERSDSYRTFIKVRKKFENIIIKYDYIVQQIVRNFRGATKSYPYIKDFYLLCIKKLLEGKSEEQAINAAVRVKDFGKLAKISDAGQVSSKDFSSDAKSEAYIRDAIKTAQRCKICGGYLHRNSISIDHVNRKREGGLGRVDNAQLTHFYCNSTIKQ